MAMSRREMDDDEGGWGRSFGSRVSNVLLYAALNEDVVEGSCKAGRSSSETWSWGRGAIISETFPFRPESVECRSRLGIRCVIVECPGSFLDGKRSVLGKSFNIDIWPSAHQAEN